MTGDWPCHRCGTDNVLAVLRRPGTWTNAAGNRIPVVHERHLCARCDADDPLSGPVVEYLTAGEGRDREDATQLARDLLRWIDHARPATPDEDALTAEIDAWYRGERDRQLPQSGTGLTRGTAVDGGEAGD
ncbi:hypothetical protein GCM10022225_64980 [Plantactinospora mayteni]|uniref:Uncharacterized protein n=1 Tax=Plantactinospora mayteni TaxID=566021 RepID=A0ABQ4F0I5_9ACTN|nr:DUF6300 family protein [Plantactinospora mayteni]GIH00431.1 hypothetical protein Pma05_70030 [Plantactinospora mayteni]